jgi:hypothetical protein
MTTDATGAAGLIAGILSLLVSYRQRSVQRRDMTRLQERTDRGHRECLQEIVRVGAEMEESEKNARLSQESLRDGRPGMPARARALQGLRSGMAAETVATELGLPRNEVQLLAKVAAILAVGN